MNNTDIIEATSTDISTHVWEVPKGLVNEPRLRLPLNLTAKQAQAERHEMSRVYARIKTYMNFLEGIIRETLEVTGAQRAVVRREQPALPSPDGKRLTSGYAETVYELKPEMVYGVLPGHEEELMKTLFHLWEKGLIPEEDLRKAGEVKIIPETKEYKFQTVTLKKLCEKFGEEVRQAIQQHWVATQVGTKLEVK